MHIAVFNAGGIRRVQHEFFTKKITHNSQSLSSLKTNVGKFFKLSAKKSDILF